jgi:hypothetical protein
MTCTPLLVALAIASMSVGCGTPSDDAGTAAEKQAALQNAQGVYVATSEQTHWGTVTGGSYTETQQEDGVFETVSEAAPSYDSTARKLDHAWHFAGVPAGGYTLRVVARKNATDVEPFSILWKHVGDEYPVTRDLCVFTGDAFVTCEANIHTNGKDISVEVNDRHAFDAVTHFMVDFVGLTRRTDVAAPVITLSSPAAGATVQGVVGIWAQGSDDIGITTVDFFVDGALVGTVTAGTFTNFSASWDTLQFANGGHVLTARAHDVAGNTTVSAPVTVTVSNPDDPVAPTGAITSPAPEHEVWGTVELTADASDNVGVARVDFFVNGTLLGTDTAAPYALSWDTTGVLDDAYELSIRVYDATGNVSTDSVLVYVVNGRADTQAPAASITAPASGATVSGTVSITASATDNVGVDRVEFFRGTTLLATDTTLPYAVSWNTATVANGAQSLSIKVYDAAGNVTTQAITVNISNAAPTTAALTVSASGRTGVNITSTPAGITVASGQTRTASFTAGTSVRLAVGGGRSAIFSGACSSGGAKVTSCTFTLNANATVSANIQ